MRNHNNEFILEFKLRETKMADFECRQLEIQLEFVCWSFAECNNYSEGSSKRKKGAQVIQVRGVFFNSNYLFHSWGYSGTPYTCVL